MLLLATATPTFAGQTTFDYDNLNRLVKVNFADGSHTRFEYDSDGNRKLQITVAKPTVLAVVNPNPMPIGSLAYVSWITTGATSLSLNCTAAGTGYRISNEPITQVLSGSFAPFYPIAAWAGYPSTCVWTATGPGGSGTFQHPLVTVQPPPIQVTIQPNPLILGRDAVVSWSTTNATALTLTCTASGTGYVTPTVSMTPVASGAFATFVPPAEWVGYPSQCTWRASGPGGNFEYTHPLVTQAVQSR